MLSGVPVEQPGPAVGLVVQLQAVGGPLVGQEVVAAARFEHELQVVLGREQADLVPLAGGVGRLDVVGEILGVALPDAGGGPYQDGSPGAGEDGISHQAIEDLSLACSLPGFTVIVPADAIETAQAVRAAAINYGPFYIRLCRPKVPPVYTEDYRFNLGKAVSMRQGKDAAIIAVGLMVTAALEAAAELEKQGIDCSVLNMPILKPIDEQAVIDAAGTGAIVTAEEHLEHGGLGSIIAQVVAQHQPVPVEFVAIKDTYAKSGKPAELLERYGLTAEDIAQAVHRAIKRKR